MHKPTRRMPVINQFGLFPVRVSKVRRLSEHFVRISLAGPSLHHAVNEISDGTGDTVDAYIKLFVPPRGATGPVDFPLNETWRHDYMARHEAERGAMRTYTVRNSRLVPASTVAPLNVGFRPNEAADSSVLERALPEGLIPEIDIDFVLHTDASGHMGPGASWAAAAREGDAISFLAPLRENNLWSSYNPAEAKRLIVAADETAVPAALSVVRSLTPGVRADVLLEVPGERDILDDDVCQFGEVLAQLPEVRVHWLPRGCDGFAPIRGQRLQRRLREVVGVPQPEALPAAACTPAQDAAGRPDEESDFVWGLAADPGDTYVFIAGESAMIKTLRRICVNEAGIDKSAISFMGYFKSGRAES